MSLESDLSDIVHLINPAIPAIDTQPDDGTSAWVNDEVSVTVQLLSAPRQGHDERRLARAGNQVRERVYGNRSLRVQFTVNTNKQTFAQTALEVADDLTAGLSRSDVSDILEARDLGVPVCSPVRQVNAPDAHGDVRSIAVFEAVFPSSRRHTGALVDRIDAVNVTGTTDDIESDVTAGPVL